MKFDDFPLAKELRAAAKAQMKFFNEMMKAKKKKVKNDKRKDQRTC